jgi:hypothetical protein
MLSCVLVVELIWLIFLSPFLLRILGKLYRRPISAKTVSSTLLEGDNEVTPSDEEDWKASISSRRDVHISVLSYLLEATSEFCIGLSQTGTQMIACEYNKRYNDMHRLIQPM